MCEKNIKPYTYTINLIQSNFSCSCFFVTVVLSNILSTKKNATLSFSAV